MSPYKTSSGDSLNNAPSSPTSQTSTSLEPSSPIPLARSWYTSSVARPPRAQASCSTSPPTLPQAKRQSVPFSSTARPRGNKRPRPLRPRAHATPRRRGGKSFFAREQEEGDQSPRGCFYRRRALRPHLSHRRSKGKRATVTRSLAR